MQPPTRIRLSSRLPSRLALPVLATALALAACDPGSSEAPDRSMDGPEVTGAALSADAGREGWSLLTVPREGGVARARSMADPARVVWEGETRLPPAREIQRIEGPSVLLRTADGVVHRYEPRTDELSRVGTVTAGARWSGWDRYGLWVDPERSSLLQIGPEGSWRYEMGASLWWAAPVEQGRVAALVEENEASALWLVGRGESEPEARARDGFTSPGLVTAWGRRLVLSGAGDGTVRFFAVPSMAPAGRVEVGGPVTALAASPSSHQIYVGVDEPPRLMKVDRLSKEASEMTGLPRPARELRPAVLGGSLLVSDGEALRRVSLVGGDTVGVPGSWREDLPLALPDDRVILVRDGEVALWSSGGSSTELEVSPARWWSAVRWNPAPPPVVSDRISDEDLTSGLNPDDSAAGDTAAPAPGETGPSAPGDSGAAAGPAPGFYAVMTAAREREGVRDLLDRLEEGGYRTALQEHHDDAGRTWYRGLVGPFSRREGAEAAARQLRRERDMDGWVTELRPGATTGEIFR